MVTASHNPKDDNGYKVYWENGAQIVEPHDKGISQCIMENLKPWEIPSIDTLISSSLCPDPTEDVKVNYFRSLYECIGYRGKEQNGKVKNFPIVYTPMHGVGKEWMRCAFEQFGIEPYIGVVEQLEPDGDFPTVEFPNPEEGKGALRLALETAERVGSRLVIANDPDADRLAIAERHPLTGEWKIFNGNEIGILLAHWCWINYARTHKVEPSQCVVLNSTVSSKMLASLAQQEGLCYEETLTGFKWLGNKVFDLRENSNPALQKRFVFAFEEAIGYMVTDLCLDKDGISAGVMFAELALELYSNSGNRTVLQQLDSLYEKYGYFSCRSTYFFCYDPQLMTVIFDRIRNQGRYLHSLGRGQFIVKHYRDLTVGIDTRQPSRKPTLPISSSTHMITFYFEGGATVTLRGSGTEPKLKIYLEVVGNDRELVHQISKTLERLVADELLEPQRNGLIPPKD